MCTTEQTRLARVWQDRYRATATARTWRTQMLILIVPIALAAVVILTRVGMPATSDLASLGVMSDRWLAECRASRTS